MKLYVYPNARIGSHDLIPGLEDTTPMSIAGRKRHFTETSDPAEADFIFMGQISCGTMHEFKNSDFPLLEQYKEKHVFELEGDWASNVAEPWCADLIKSGNSSKPEHLKGILCVRPAVGKLLKFLAIENPEYELEFPETKEFCFRGYPDPFGVRVKVVQMLHQYKMPGTYNLNPHFYAAKPLESPEVNVYVSLLHSHLLSICPRGAGVDSIRFYETCFFGRVPICISDAKWLNEERYDMSFAYRFSPSMSSNELASEFQKILDTPHEKLVERGRAAREYFQKVVVPYFNDPTLYFIEYLKYKNIIK